MIVHLFDLTYEPCVVFENTQWLQAKVFWVVTQYSVVVGYQHFRGPCCLHLHLEDGY
jgi:hypothetical protein